MSVTLVATSIHTLAVFTLETDYLHCSKPVKIDGQTDRKNQTNYSSKIRTVPFSHKE